MLLEMLRQCYKYDRDRSCDLSVSKNNIFGEQSYEVIVIPIVFGMN